MKAQDIPADVDSDDFARVANWQPNDVAVVLIRDRSSGRVHRRVKMADRPGLMSFERCQADQAGAFDVIPDLSDVSDEHQFCTVCFGPLDGDEAGDVPVGPV